MDEVQESTSNEGNSSSKSKIEEILKTYWELGMTDLSSKEGKRIAEMALKENDCISRKQLKTWIGNYKRKLSGKIQVKVKPSHVNAKTRKRSAKDFFQEEFLRENKGKMSSIGSKWKQVKDDPLQFDRYQAMADQINKEGFILTEREKELKALKIQKNMQIEAVELQKLGFECFGMIAKPNSNLIGEFGSGKGKKFLNNHKLCWEFASEINVSERERNKDQWENLRQAVQDKLNVAYEESGLGKSHVEWKRVKAGEVEVHGFPDCIKPSPACTFGSKNLKRILDEDVVIVFKEVARSEQIDEDENEEAAFERYELNANVLCDEIPTIPHVNDEQQSSSRVACEDSQVLEEGLYKIDYILEKKIMKKVTHYLVKWTGYPEPTWEPYTNIDVQIRKRFNETVKNDL